MNLSLMCETNAAGLSRSCKTIGPAARTWPVRGISANSHWGVAEST